LSNYRLVVFDMAGTTVRDDGAVEAAFLAAADSTGLSVDRQAIHARRGLSKRRVFRELWGLHGAVDDADVARLADASHAAFRAALAATFEKQPVAATEGCVDCFAQLRAAGIAIALTTGFHRAVTDTILARLGWDEGLDHRRMGPPDTAIQASVCSEDVPQGRPAPDMIHRAMRLLAVDDPCYVAKVGDTPADLEAGRNAGCGMTLGVTNGSHTEDQLARHPSDGLLPSLSDLPAALGV
jgi:phosphonatase-like hydrolase